MVRQCTCSAIAPCKQQYIASLIPCADSCQKYAQPLGANYQALKSCLLQRQGQIENTISCTENSFPNACARSNPLMVKKRYPETLKIAAMSELNSMFNRMGLRNQIQSLLATGKRFFGCLMTCMDRKAGNCSKRLGCGLDLPSDSVMVQTAKQCAIRSGFNTQGAQALCQCAASAGIRQLVSICPRLQIN
uniref:Uncharacterized protein n=1 Tax=Acrobeloides nanus TaxID=290746 RepID=A0A914DZ22_9BILA